MCNAAVRSARTVTKRRQVLCTLCPYNAAVGSSSSLGRILVLTFPKVAEDRISQLLLELQKKALCRVDRAPLYDICRPTARVESV